MCSRSRLVTTARIGDSFRNERSLSSASATRYCVVPSRAFDPIASTRPPTTTVGSKPARGQHRSHHRGRRRLAVHSGDGDAVLQPHQLGQHLRPLDHGNLARMRLQHLGVGRRHGRAGHHHRRAGHVGGVVALVDRRAQLRQPVRHRRRGAGPSRRPSSPCSAGSRQSAHADAADSDEVRVLRSCKHEG